MGSETHANDWNNKNAWAIFPIPLFKCRKKDNIVISQRIFKSNHLFILLGNVGECNLAGGAEKDSHPQLLSFRDTKSNEWHKVLKE